MMTDVPPPPPYSIHDPHQAELGVAPQYTQTSIDSSGEANNSEVHRSIRSRPPSAVPTQTTFPGFVSAAPYFELRPCLQSRPQTTVYHYMPLGVEACPENLPFPEPLKTWTSRGIDQQDWKTFLHHLFPQSDSEKERVRLHHLGIEAGSSAGSSSIHQELEPASPRQSRIKAVQSQWNRGFFGPRGLEIIIDFVDDSVLLHYLGRRGTNVLQNRQPSGTENSLLHQLVARGKTSQVKLLLSKGGEDIEALNRDGETSLYKAVSRGDKDMVKLLLGNGADPMARPPKSDSLLHIACYHDRKNILKLLLATGRTAIEESNSKGETPLYAAMSRWHRSCMEILIEAGAAINARPAGKDSMLHMAISNDSSFTANLLLQKGAYLEESKDGETPLFRAVSRGSNSLTKLFLEHGASAAVYNKKGEAPLSLAVSRGDKTTVTLLLTSRDINIEVLNEKKETPLYVAIARAYSSIAELLIKSGANTRVAPPGADSLLNLTVSRGQTSLTHSLLECGVDLEEKNKSGETPLFQAISRDDITIFSLLLAKGAIPDTSNNAGETALQLAASRSNASIVSLLLAKGASPDLAIKTGETPLYTAVSRSNVSMVSILLSHGANPNLRSLCGELPLARAIYVASIAIVSLLLSRSVDMTVRTTDGLDMLDYAIKRGDRTIIHLIEHASPPRRTSVSLLGPAEKVPLR